MPHPARAIIAERRKLSALQLQEHSYVPDGKPSGAKTLRKSLTKLAHRFVPGAAAKGTAAPRPALSDHTFLPEAPAKTAEVR